MMCDLLVDIFPPVPVKTLYRLRCISKEWNALVTEACKKLPQTISGLFYHTNDDDLSHVQYVSIHDCHGNDVVDATLSFLPFPKSTTFILVSCNELLFGFSSEPHH